MQPTWLFGESHWEVGGMVSTTVPQSPQPGQCSAPREGSDSERRTLGLIAHCRAALTIAWKAAQLSLLNSSSVANKSFDIFCRGWAFMTHLHVKIIWVWSLGLLLFLVS